MITPALLLSATGTFILSTSNRLARIVDRVRFLSQHVEDLSSDPDAALLEERIERYRGEIKMQSHRLRLIQTALTMLYFAAVMFVCTSVAIGLVSTVSLVCTGSPSPSASSAPASCWLLPSSSPSRHARPSTISTKRPSSTAVSPDSTSAATRTSHRLANSG